VVQGWLVWPLRRRPSAPTSARCCIGVMSPYSDPVPARLLLIVGAPPPCASSLCRLGSPATDCPHAAAAFLPVPAPALPGSSGPPPLQPRTVSRAASSSSSGAPSPSCGLRPLRLGSRRRSLPSFRLRSSHAGAASLPPQHRCGCGWRAWKEVPSLPSAPPFLQRPVLQWYVAGLSPPGGVRAADLAFCVGYGGVVSAAAFSCCHHLRHTLRFPLLGLPLRFRWLAVSLLALEF
jgi:hypothetical protein